MIGHGRPLSHFRFNSFFRGTLFVTMLVLVCYCAPTGWSQILSNPASRSPTVSTKNLSEKLPTLPTASLETNSPLPIRLRISWGGGQSRQWSGSISVINGAVTNVQSLGLTSDAVGSVVLVNQNIIINHWSPTNYGGAEFSMVFETDAILKVELSAPEDPTQRFVHEFKVTDLLSETAQQELDAVGNRLVVGRAPGDLIPVSFQRKHLVFSPGELFEIGIRANRTQFQSQSINCRLRLNVENGSAIPPPNASTYRLGSGIWKEAFTLNIDRNGSAEESLVQIPIPNEEGIYQLEIELTPQWQQASFRGKTVVSRNVQFIVLQSQPKSSPSIAEWRLLTTIDPTSDHAHPQLPLTQLSKFILPTPTATLGNELRHAVTIQQQSMLALMPGGWEAIPIPVEQLNHPQLIEIEYLTDHPTSIGLSVLQPDAGGQIPLYGFDSGISVPRKLIEIDSGNQQTSTQWHRFVFWPEHKTPYLLIANRHAKRNATIGQIRILSGPERLPGFESKLASATDAPDAADKRLKNRKFMAFYESPLFAENFNAPEALDLAIGQPLDDWSTFYVGADRLIQLLKANGYGGAFVSVAADGSSIYPSQILGSSPKHDTGIFFANGQDPVRKDVLEMLFRMFERENLVLIPTLALSGPLPEIETFRLEEVHQQDPFGLVHANQSRSEKTVNNRLPIYNPLNLDVQNNVTQVVQEIADRYRSFPSFQGLAIVCRPDTYTLLPGQQWGYDPMTVSRFWQSQTDLGDLPTDPAEIQKVLLQSHASAWVHWRAHQISNWYQTLLAELKKSVPASELYIAPVDIYRNEELAAAFSPSLHSSVDVRQQLIRIGLDADVFAKTNGLNLLKPHRIASNQSSAANRVELGLEHNRQADDFYLQAKSSGDIYVQRASWAHFSQLESQDPYGTQTTSLMRLQPMSPAGLWNRKRFLEAMRVSDTRMLIDGGTILPSTQDAELGEFIQIFGQLPDQEFTNLPLAPELEKYNSSTQPVVVRFRQQANRTWFYAVNPSPWPVKVHLTLESSTLTPTPQINSLSSKQLFVTNQRNGQQIEFEMEALSMVGGVSKSPLAIHHYQFQLPEHAANRLRKQVYALQLKLAKSASVEPIPVLKNSSFEFYGQSTLAGWDIGQQSSPGLQLNDQDGQQGTSSLRMQNVQSPPVWIRSNAIEPPATGRISVSVWLRTDTPDKQPPLRLAIEGTLGDSSYYRFGSVGALSPNPQTNQISQQWQRFAVHFDDLPTERLTNLRIGFDLMGPGEVHLDNVEVFDRWLDEQDAKAITQRLAGCGPLLTNPMTLESCRLILESYWLQFLDEQFEDQKQANNPPSEPTSSRPAPGNSETKNEVEPTNSNEENGRQLFRRFRRIGGNRNNSLR